MAASVVAGSMLVVDIWTWTTVSRDTITILTSVGLVVAHANMCVLIPLRTSQLWIRAGTIAAAILTAGCADALWILDIRGDSLVERVCGAATIAMGCGTLALAILLRYNRTTATEDAAVITKITIMCPRCQCKQTVALGDVRCSRCDLGLQIHVDTAPTNSAPSEEPLCAAPLSG